VGAVAGDEVAHVGEEVITVACSATTRFGYPHGPGGVSGVAATRISPVSGWVSFAQDSKHVGFVQAIAIPHASARSTWCASGASGWTSQTQPSAHRLQERIAELMATVTE
jgi:hypothetical protein